MYNVWLLCILYCMYSYTSTGSVSGPWGSGLRGQRRDAHTASTPASSTLYVTCIVNMYT